jgi:multiple sugar transport system substrate-binding protein
MSVYDPKTVEFFKQDGVQVGVPFDLYPSMLWYKKEFFDEIDLAEPPHEWGAKYTMPDGTEVDWDYDALRQVAMLLTVDKNGQGRDRPCLRPEEHRPVRLRAAARRSAPDRCLLRSGLARGRRRQDRRHPDAWKAAWKFMYDGIWKDHFIMTEAQFNDAKVGGGDQAFFGGHVAMANNFLWTSYGVTGDEAAVKDWNLARSLHTTARPRRHSTPTRSRSSRTARTPTPRSPGWPTSTRTVPTSCSRSTVASRP